MDTDVERSGDRSGPTIETRDQGSQTSLMMSQARKCEMATLGAA